MNRGLAALILLGKRTTLSRHLAQSEVIFEYRTTEASGPAQEREEYREPLILVLDTPVGQCLGRSTP